MTHHRHPSPAARELGVVPSGDGAYALVWAPYATEVAVEHDGGTTTLAPAAHGHHAGHVPGLHPGDDYWLVLTTEEGERLRRPDPASRHQPHGVDGPSRVDDPAAFAWTDDGWRPPARHELVLYELHVGTFTEAGTLDAAIERLPVLAEDGVTAVELMPVAAFPGERNWGYDGVFPWAVQESYGGPDALRRFVDAAHAAGVAVHLDVVYNHLGPEGNVLGDLGPYFTDRYATPWGEALNVDGPDSDPVRRYVVDNAVRWVRDFHVDGLRLDAVHAIHDESATHLLAELTDAVHAEGARQRRRVDVVAESDANDPRLVRDPAVGGYGLDGAWNDDFHHALHTVLTGESEGYYADYGTAAHLAACLRDRYVHAGTYSAYRRRRVGAPADDVPHERLVVCAQNHDQVGNRATGDRVLEALPLAQRRLARALLLLSPFTPLLFMGEEHGAPEPFPYFTSHAGEELAEAVRQGRRREFAGFTWDEVPDPQDPATFAAARIDWSRREDGVHATLLALTRELLRLRRTTPAIAGPGPGAVTAHAVDDVVVVGMRRGDSAVSLVANTGDVDADVPLDAPVRSVLLDTADVRWDGSGSTVADPAADEDRTTVTVAPHAAVLVSHDVEELPL